MRGNMQNQKRKGRHPGEEMKARDEQGEDEEQKEIERFDRKGGQKADRGGLGLKRKRTGTMLVKVAPLDRQSREPTSTSDIHKDWQRLTKLSSARGEAATPLNSSLIQLHLQTRHFGKKKSTLTSSIDVRCREYTEEKRKKRRKKREREEPHKETDTGSLVQRVRVTSLRQKWSAEGSPDHAPRLAHVGIYGTRVEGNFGLRNLVHGGKWGIMFSLRLKDFCLAWEASCVHWPLRWAPPDPLQQQPGPDNLTPFNKASFSKNNGWIFYFVKLTIPELLDVESVRSEAKATPAAAKFNQSLMKLLSADDAVELIREPLWPI
ncbi:hypothetical protein WN51_02905 [Melipona quadrifasciata]|uniref:Uncharacterized protein n=1 Tax=Melipona quadrifasciata TaxID=166423 RepID=A0A0M9ABA6_9HYME|nr:hypothetical protein WN51_02905 [Melipona quadrifasciata]